MTLRILEIVDVRWWNGSAHHGLTFAQAAEIVGVSERTGKRMWAYARAWLYEEISGRGEPKS